MPSIYDIFTPLSGRRESKESGDPDLAVLITALVVIFLNILWRGNTQKLGSIIH